MTLRSASRVTAPRLAQAARANAIIIVSIILVAAGM
jgi:hypothetical protein